MSDPRAALCAARHGRLSAAPIATVALPVGPRRLRQEGLTHTPANPRTQTHSPAHQDSTRNRLTVVQALPSPCIAGGLQGGQPFLPSPNVGEGPGVRLSAHPTAHQVQPVIQVPPHPRPCSTADTGFSASTPPAPLRLVIAAEAAIHVPLHCGGTIGG